MVLKEGPPVLRGHLRWRTMYFPTLVSPTSMPSLSSSPWMWREPQSGFSRLSLRISSRTSSGTFLRPRFPRRTFQGPEPSEASAVPCDHSLRPDNHEGASPVAPHLTRPGPETRSALVSLGRFAERCRTLMDEYRTLRKIGRESTRYFRTRPRDQALIRRQDMDSFGRQANADFTTLITPIRGATRIHAAEDVIAAR
jgi:hypothetical protein